jgi:hypothetical protein
MNHYEVSIPRVILGIGAVAMTAITLAVFVLLPAAMRAYDDPTSTLSGIVSAAAAGADARAASVNFDSVGRPTSASGQCTTVERNHVQQM